MASRLALWYADFAESHIKGDEKPWNRTTPQLSLIQRLNPKEIVHSEAIKHVIRTAPYIVLIPAFQIKLEYVQFAKLLSLKSNFEDC